MPTFAQMAAERDPLYQATEPHGDFARALMWDAEHAALELPWQVRYRDAALLQLALKALKA
jgi:hypothetical protein